MKQQYCEIPSGSKNRTLLIDFNDIVYNMALVCDSNIQVTIFDTRNPKKPLFDIMVYNNYCDFYLDGFIQVETLKIKVKGRKVKSGFFYFH